MLRRPTVKEQQSKTARVIEMACADDGVCAADVKREFGCNDNQANSLIVGAALNGDLVRERSRAGKFHYFQGREQRAEWVERDEARARQEDRSRAELKTAREAAQAKAPTTVYQRPPPQGDRVDVMADPLPGVPGWRSGPAIRPGALDYTRHQSGSAGSLAGAPR